ncbi:hypothetical protein [Prescottella equi]|uniref:Uncharacterized protein n=1 Tax=Rhodococcus phage REQ2 TaxID=1109713 RepID=G9FGX3_9CAUD|nr:hypothetical protein [Prescottella equi]YP_005087074.1 hypothetical protein RoPhREQ2_gp30 [Rhodococcus phage REQ2]AEV51884.1 hypothetical protein [Rhodococcus phage REQ2]
MKQGRVADGAAWIALAVAVLGLIGCLTISAYGGALVWIIVGGGAGLILAERRRRRSAAAAAEIAARADRENELYLDGDAAGVYGQFHLER